MGHTPTMICGLCRHGRRDPQNLKVVICYRYPPVPYPVQQGPGQMGTVNARPSMREDETCGEWSAKLDLVN